MGATVLSAPSGATSACMNSYIEEVKIIGFHKGLKEQISKSIPDVIKSSMKR